MDFWRQVGRENGAKIDPKRHRKSDGKMEGTKMAKRSQQAVTRRGETRGPEPWGGGRGRGKPLPEGRGEGGRGKYTTLNHLSPEGWWDYKKPIKTHNNTYMYDHVENGD